MRKKSILFILALLLISKPLKSQSFNVDSGVGLGVKPTGERLGLHLSPGIGYSFNDQDYLYGGIQLDFYRLRDSETTDPLAFETESIISSAILGGYRYLFPIGVLHEATSREKRFGLFPEVRLYLNPYLPRRIEFLNDQGETVILKGDHKIQVAYGVALGIYFEPHDSASYFAIKVELNNLDMFEVLRTLVDLRQKSGQIVKRILNN